MSEQDNKPFERMTKKELIEFIQNTLTSDLGEIRSHFNQTRENVDTDLEQTRSHLEQTKQTANTELDTARSHLEQTKQNANADLTEIQKIKNTASEVNLDEIKEKEDDANASLEEIGKYYSKLFTDEEASEEKPEGQKSTKTQIEDLLTGYQGTHEKWEQKFPELKAKIESLLPGAASAGLASNFAKSKEAAEKVVWLWIGFIVSLSSLAGFYAFLIFYGGDPNWVTVFLRLPMGIPFGWAAWYCQRSITKKGNISELYNHKANIMALYEGFARALEGDAKIQLAQGTIEEILHNPIIAMDDSDSSPPGRVAKMMDGAKNLMPAKKNTAQKAPPEKDDAS